MTAIKEVGSIVEFGAYEQDNDQSNGKEPIEWIVLDVQDGKSLLISRYGLDCRPYHTQEGPIYWKNCSLRSWLYNEFPTIAFTEAEQKSILVTTVDNSTKQRFSEPGTNAESDTQERIFLLGYEETEKFLASDSERRCAPTAYAIAQGAHVDDNGASNWWLRTPGYKQSADSVLADGTVGSQSLLRQSDVTVRPAIWVSNAVKAEDRERVEEERERIKAERLQRLREKVIIGLDVSFGSYEQDNNLANGPEPIEWIVLDVQDGKVLLVSKYGLDCQPYNIKYECVTWETCTLRNWLNRDFLNIAFSDDEKKLIMEMTVENSEGLEISKWTASGNTYDLVFLLSYAEVVEYFSSKDYIICQPTEFAFSNGAYKTGTSGNCRWWVRLPGYYFERAAYIDIDGSLGESHYYSQVDNRKTAVRPAMWINLESEIF